MSTSFQALRKSVYAANMLLRDEGLVIFTWGNASGIDREHGIVAIKPSGVAYDRLSPDAMVLVDTRGTVVAGDRQPSTDLLTHLELYRAFPSIGGIAHTHSEAATAFAQAHEPIPCLGTTHADHFFGPVPVTRALTSAETSGDYERNTGRLIAETFKDGDPGRIPAVLVAEHGPFTWGRDAGEAVTNSAVLEAVARMALATRALRPSANGIARHLLERHFFRKHGPTAYYGQVDASGTKG